MIPVSWPAEESSAVSRQLTGLMRITTVGRWGEIATRAQRLAAIRLAREGKKGGHVKQEDLRDAVLCAGEEWMPEVAD